MSQTINYPDPLNLNLAFTKLDVFAAVV